MLWLFFIAWILSPIVLIPLTIIITIRKSKLEDFISELYSLGRINLSEYSRLEAQKEKSAPVADAPVFNDSEKPTAKPVPVSDTEREIPTPVSVNEPARPARPVISDVRYEADANIVGKLSHIADNPPEKNSSAPPKYAEPVFRDEETAKAVRQPAVHNEPESIFSASAKPTAPVFRDEEAAKPVRQPAPVKSAVAEKHTDTNKRAGAMSVLMTIGIIFVVLAGLVFSTAVWVNLGKLGRTCAIGVISALFFGISAFSGKKLKLESTSFAFYTLGTFFSAITLITAGFFGLFGSFLSVSGGGSSLLFALAALIISLLSANGHRIFQKNAAAYISVFSGAMSAVLLCVQLSDEKGMFALLMSLLTLAVNTIVYSLNVSISEKWEKPVITASALLYALALISGVASLFTDSAMSYACAGLYGARSVIVAVMGFKGHSIYKNRASGAVSLLSGIFFSAALMWKLSGTLQGFALAVTVFAFVFIGVFVAMGLKAPEEWDGFVKFSAFLLYAIGIISTFAALGRSFGEWDIVCFTAAGLHIVYSFAAGIMAVYGHNVYEKACSAFASLFTGMAFSVMLIAELSESTAVAAICLTALFLVFINGIYSVSARLPEGWKIAVDISAAVLGIISTLCSLFVLGDNYGHWDISCFVIAALYIIQSIAVTIMAYKGHNIYGKAIFGILSQLTGIGFTVITLSELAADGKQLALFLAIFAVLYLNFAYTFSLNKPQGWKIPVDLSAVFLFVPSAIYAGCQMINNTGVWGCELLLCAAVYIGMAIAVTIMAYKGYNTYSKAIFGILSQLTGIGFTVITLSELASDGKLLALFLAIFAVLYLNFAYTFSLKKPNSWKMPVDLSAVFLFVPSAIYAGCQMINNTGVWGCELLLCAAVYIGMAIAVTIMAYKGYNTYSKAIFGILSQLTGIGFTVITLSELAADGKLLALFLAIFAVLYLNFAYTFSFKKPQGWKMPVDLSAVFLFVPSVIYAGCQMINNTGVWGCELLFCAAVYIAMAIAVTVMAYLGHSEFISSRWAVFSHMTGLIFTALLLGELAPCGRCFDLFLALLAVLFTAAGDITIKRSPEKWLTVTKAAEILLNTVAAIASAAMLIVYNTDWEIYCFITAALYILYTAVWGIRLNNSLLKAAECVISSFALFNAYCLITENFSELPFILVSMLFALALIHHYAKPLRTMLSDIFLPAAVIISSLCQVSDDNGVFGFLSFTLLLILLLIKSAEKENSFAKIFGILLPLPVSGMVFSIASMLGIALPGCFEYAVNAAVLAVIAAAVMTAKKRSCAVFYSFAITASVMALAGTGSHSMGIQLLILAVTVFLTVLFGKASNNIPSLLTITGSALAVGSLADMAEPIGGNAVHILAAVIFASASLIASRVFFSKKLLEKETGSFRLDTFCTGIILSIPMLDGLSGNANTFAVLTLLALFIANLARKEHKDDLNRAFLTAGCGLFTIALINRPFLTVTDPLFSFKITLGLICIFGYVFSRIWKKYPVLSENFSTAVYGISFMCLIIEALSRQNLFNTLIVLGVSLVILLYSFIRKKKRWFIVSSVALTGLTLYIFRDFFLMIDWWVYLLVVGLLLIAVASANEYFIKKGRELKEKAGRFFEDWKW